MRHDPGEWPTAKATRPAWDTGTAATNSGAIADTYPGHELAALHTAARDGTRATLGDDACQYEFGIQHLVDVTADPQAKTITWERVTRVPLGTAL